MTIKLSAGTILSIGTTAADATADSYTAIGSLASLPEYGDEYDDVTFESLSLATYLHNTGAKNSASMSVSIGYDLSDSGQAAVLAANGVNSYYNFKVTYPDAKPDYFKAKVQGYKMAPGGMTANVMASIKLQPQPGSYDLNNAAAAPANSVLPAISGIAQVGVTLTALSGTWTNDPTFTYVWKLDGSPISAATNSTYTVLIGDIGSVITVTVTGTNAAGNASATSAGTADVIAA